MDIICDFLTHRVGNIANGFPEAMEKDASGYPDPF